ncbi:MAG: S8 family serine peptidase [Acidobacteria bacterium]|nr:S8 family serine peptidase [Acidobacteriota bacterium]MBI3654825.1 S8 family serine peptidase [Acidobacteriota bacterium]
MQAQKIRANRIGLSLVVPLTVLLMSGFIRAEGHARIDPQILSELEKSGESRFIIYMKEKANLNAASVVSDWRLRGDIVFNALRATAEISQAPLLEILREKSIAGNAAEVSPYWICNCVAVTGDSNTLRAVAGLSYVDQISANYEFLALDPNEVLEEVDGAPLALEWNVEKVRADQVWNTYGITGAGVTIGSMDTGVAWTHEALQRQYRGWNDGNPDHNYNWLDAVRGNPVPRDSQSHGTHTMGTMVGDNGAGRQIGVAPGAKWISVLTIDGSTAFIEATHKGFQWMLAPTDLAGENPDPDQRPVAVNNSWGCFAGLCPYNEFIDDVDAWASAGILAEFSAGNEGPRSSSMRWPGDYASSFTTGATQRDDTIWRSSSRGPARDGSIKPNVSAPGVNVMSSVPVNRYGLNSGTSMAGPHVVAIAALMLEANPALSISDIQTILQDTAIPYGTGRPNNDYGWGRVDALNAVEAALATPR